MKKVIILLLAVCMLCSGCSSELLAVLSNESGFFYRLSERGEDDLYLTEGTVCQIREDENLELVRLAAEKDSTVTVTGKQKSVKGDIRLVYTAPDGTETLIADGDDTDIDTVIEVRKGIGKIGFIPVRSSGSPERKSVYDFDFRLKAGEGVTFKGHGSKEVESPEPLEAPESEEIREKLDTLEEPEWEDAFPEVEDRWPESIVFKTDGLYAKPLIVDFDMEQSGKISVAYAARSGKLRLKIVNDAGEVYFEKADIRAGDEEENIVDIDEGTYWVYLYAEYYGGEIVIKPEG